MEILEFGTKIKIISTPVERFYFVGNTGVVCEPPGFEDERDEGLYWVNFSNQNGQPVVGDGIWCVDVKEFEVVE